MRARLWILVAAAAFVPLAAAGAQHEGGGATSDGRPPREAAQYDFLVGQWELTVRPRVSGLAARIHGVPRLRGSWKGWRALDGWGIEDELRIVDESGNPHALTRFVRVYDPRQKRWAVAAVDAYHQQVTQSTAQWRGGEMVALGEGTDAEGKRYTSRTRIGAITLSSFRYQQDRSYDGGKTWDEGRLVIDAKRVAAVAPR